MEYCQYWQIIQRPQHMSDTYKKISSRLARLGINIADHIVDRSNVKESTNTLKCIKSYPNNSKKIKEAATVLKCLKFDRKNPIKLKEATTTLDGITFHPKDSKKLEEELRNAKDSTGKRVFATRWINKIEHKPIALSFAATEGTGFREIWRFPPLPETQLRVNTPTPWSNNFSSNFGVSMTLPDSSSLHCDVSEHKCNIHIDEAGFVIEEPSGRVIVTADLFQHTVNELVFKTYIKGAFPKWANGFFDRVSLVYPSMGNNFSKMGPRMNQVRGFREINRIPIIGSRLGHVPLPGLHLDIVQSKNYKLEANALWGINGSGSITMNFSGTHNWGN